LVNTIKNITSHAFAFFFYPIHMVQTKDLLELKCTEYIVVDRSQIYTRWLGQKEKINPKLWIFFHCSCNFSLLVLFLLHMFSVCQRHSVSQCGYLQAIWFEDIMKWKVTLLSNQKSVIMPCLHKLKNYSSKNKNVPAFK
jgi:hypothetical protein